MKKQVRQERLRGQQANTLLLTMLPPQRRVLNPVGLIGIDAKTFSAIYPTAYMHLYKKDLLAAPPHRGARFSTCVK